jgi:hypothetical protein
LGIFLHIVVSRYLDTKMKDYNKSQIIASKKLK